MSAIILLSAFIIGSCVGSFLNVCICRIPAGESIVWPPSQCPRCKQRIEFYDNIPVASFIILGGRCRKCGEKISPQYPLVELFTGIITAVFVWKFGLTLWAAASLCAVYALIILSVIDMKIMIIPDRFSLGLIVFGLAVCFINPYFMGGYGYKLLQSFIGGCVGFFGFWLIAIVGRVIFRKEAMGGGDIKLMGGAGALIGWGGVLSTLFIGSVLGLVYAVYLLARRKANTDGAIPFGPFLSAGIIINMLYPTHVLYLNFISG